MSTSSSEVPVLFFQAHVLDKAEKRSFNMDWRPALEKAAALALLERTHDDDVYDVHVGDDLILVGAHRVLNTAFMTAIDHRSEQITDLMDDAANQTDVKRFAHTTVMAFMPRHNAIAIARGGTNAPRHKSAAESFLQRHVPLERGQHWQVDPVYAPEQTPELRRAKGVSMLEARYETLRILDDIDPGRAGLAAHFDKLASDLGGELVVDVTVRLRPDSQHTGSLSGFKDMVFNDLPRLAGRQKRVRAQAVYDDDSKEIIDLVAGKLATSMELPEDGTESRRYTALVQGLRDVGVEMQDRVERILGG